MESQQSKPIYIIDHYCAERIQSILEQLSEVFSEALERRRFDPANNLDFGLEEVDLAASIANFKQEELDERF